MDSFEKFMEIFRRAVRERNSTNLTEILRNSRKYFQNIAKDDTELALFKLFDCDFGLLKFIQDELKKPTPQRGFDMAIKEAFCFVQFIMEQFNEIFEPYILNTKITCQSALTTRCSALIQKAACNTFRKLIELFHAYEIEVDDTVKNFISLFHYVDIKKRSFLFSVLGTIIKYHPENPEIKEHFVAIFQQLRNDFKKQYDPNTSTSHSIDIFQVYLDTLADLLHQLPAVLEEHCEELYTWVKELSNPKKYSVKKVSMKSAVNLLSTHMDRFSKFVYRDYEYWYNLLINLAQDKNVQYSECGQRALKYFYRMIGCTLKHKSSESDKAIFLYFKNLFEEQLKSNHHVNSNILRFIVYGFSQMAAPCKRYLTNEDVKNMFSLIANCAMPLCTRDDDIDKRQLESICHYQEALSEIILHTSDLSIDQINIITKLSILLVKRFPDLHITSQNYAINSLIYTIINVGITSKNLSEEFLYNLVYSGVIWTCSHTLLVDAELQRGLDNLPERPLCYKNYVPLWLKLVGVNRYREHGQIAKDVVDTIINVGIVLIEKLNLNTKTKEDNVFSDVAYSQIAENDADFRTFINIVDLYVEIINGLESPLFINTIHKFLFKIIRISNKHHLISGFYKLVHATFKHIPNFSKDEIQVETLEMLYKYLVNVLNLIPTFSNELLGACLLLILNIPTIYIERIMKSAISTFKIALTVGISDLDLAFTALNALEKWKNHLDKQHMNAFLLEIIPFFEPYLHTGESSVEFLEDIIKTERKVIKRIILKDDEITLEAFQMKVLPFIASLDSDIIMHFIYKKSMDVGGTWDKKDLLKYSLSLSDTQVDIHFDQILPRLIQLAQNSGDRRTKLIACEVLHSIVAFVLGKTSQQLISNPDRFVPIYVHLCPVLLNLGCDYDETVRKIFHPLMLQMTHWLSSKFMLKSPATIHFIDSLFKGLINDSNSSLRDFSAMCLAEFTNWSIKQSDDERITQSNIYEVIYKITNFALHPSASKRIAAATAFNHLYTILRENEKIVSVYWLEILYSFVKSLNGCNDPSIMAALDHVERVLITKKNLLNAEHRNRRKPDEFEGSTLRNAVNWLLTQCGCLDQCCRAKCMELVVKLSEHVANCDSVRTMIKNYIDTHGIEEFNFIILHDLKSKIESISFEGLLPLLKSLDCYIWLIKNNLVDVECLFGNSNSQREVIFNCISNFVCVINNIKIEDKTDIFILLSKEVEDLQTLQCKVILTVLHFLQVLLDSDLQDNFFPDSIFNKDYYELIAKCIMCPQVVGFDTKNLEITETLPTIMKNFWQSIVKRTNSTLLDFIKFDLSIYVDKHINDFINLDEIVFCTNNCSKLKQYVRGLSFLEHHNILDQLANAKKLLSQPQKEVKRIFEILAKNCLGELVCVNVKPSVKDYLEMLMEFLLIRYEPSMIKTLINLMQNDTMLGPNFNKIEHGIYFMNMFKSEIYKYMLKNTEETVERFIEVLQGNTSFVLMMLEQLFLFVQRHKKELSDYTELLADNVIKKFTVFENAVTNVDYRKQKLMNIFAIAVHLKHKPIEVISINKDFYVWILNQLMENSDIEYRIYILENFLICLTDMTSETKPELAVILRNLRNSRSDVSPDDFSQRSVKALKIINCFNKLVTLLPITKSATVFETIISFAAGIAEHLCNEKTNDYFEKYFTSITTDYALESIQSAYKLFISLNTPENERFDILHKFLLPSFEFCKPAEIRGFFEKYIKEIHTIIYQSFIGSSSDTKQLIISKIGCYDLIAVMFAKIHVRDIDDTESAITRNAIDEVVTGKELLQSLYSNTLNVRKIKTSEPELKELMRLLHCSAYNCSIAIVSSVKNDEDSYVCIFAENKQKDQLIWENIIDCQKQYNFQQTVKEYPKYRKRLINIRKSMKERQNSSHYSYIYSYNLSSSTLTEDINAYDFNETVIRNKPDNSNKQESMSLTFENDELNNHECMASICGVLSHMVSEEISVSPTDHDIITMPTWLKCFCKSITTTKHDNVRLFMLKVILNMQTVFKPYTKLLCQKIMYATYLFLRGNQLNYIIVDVIEMLIDWQTSSPQTSNESVLHENVVQRLWEIIIQKVMIRKTNEMTKAVYKYNMNLVKTILEVWYGHLKLPACLSDNAQFDKMKTVSEAAVYLILICFVNGMEKDIIKRDEILEFLKKCLENWQDNEETILQCCECLGLILKHLDNNDALTNKKCDIIDKIRSILSQMQTKLEDRQIKCIRALCRNYPPAAMVYFEFVTDNIFRVDAQGKSNCLEIFLLCIPNLNAVQISEELKRMKFEGFLKNQKLHCEKVALKIIDSLITILPPSKILSLATLARPYTQHEDSEYREIAYGIFMNIYKKYATSSSEDNEVGKLISDSKEILLNGVLDPMEKLQEMILNFWTQDAQLTNTCKERLLEILNMYTSNVGQNFLAFTLLLILDLTKKSRDYMQKMFEPLQNCSYTDYKIAISWRTKNLGSKAPLFAPSLTSQMNQMFTQTSASLTGEYSDFTYTRPVHDSNAELLLRATQEPEFEPTYVNENSIATFGGMEEDNTFKVPKVPQPAHHKKSKRFLSSASDVSAAIRQKEIKKNIQHAEMIKEETARQRSTAKLYRRYRIGDFPDIEISHSALIEPLQQLAKNDQLICKELTASVVCSLVEGSRRDNFVEQVADSIKRIIENEGGRNSSITAVLEILLKTRITNCSSEAIAKASRSNNVNFLGSLILEEKLIYDANVPRPPIKKIRSETVRDSSSEWLQLTNLYESMNEIDVVLSIFQNHITNEDIRIASFAQASNDWEKAKEAYEKAYETESDLVKEHCLQGLFECLSNLCSWDKVDDYVKCKLNRNLDEIWDDPWKDWMFPWLYEVHARKLLDQDYNEAFTNDVTCMQNWLNNPEYVHHLKRFFGNELSLSLIDSHAEVARDFLLNTLDEMRLQWISFHPLSTQLRIRMMQKLRITNDINVFLKTKKTIKRSEINDILKFWNNSVPSTQDALLPWDKLTSYRIYFIDTLLNSDFEREFPEDETQSNLVDNHDVNEDGLHKKMIETAFNIRLKMFEAAVNQKNKYIAKKYALQLEQAAEQYSTDMVHEFHLMNAKIKYLMGETETNAKKKLTKYASSWKLCHNLLRNDDIEDIINVNTRKQISTLASKIVELSEEDETFAELLTKSDVILGKISVENNDISNIRESLETYNFNQLKTCCDMTPTNIKECYFSLSKYCYDRLSRGTNDVRLSKEFVHSILKAMSYGSLEAAHYFPCLLKPEYFDDQETKDIFVKESEAIQTWLFLSWQAQLFSHLGTSIAPLVIPILKRIVKTYPNAVIYTFRLTVETNSALLNETSTYEIRQILYDRPNINRFMIGMQYVVQPELYLQHYLCEFKKDLSLGTATAVDILLKKIYPSARDNKEDPKPGYIFNEIAAYKSKIQELTKKKPEEIRQRVTNMIESIKESLRTRKDRLKLRDYSPWLCNFPERDVEIPGQYTGNRKPMPQYHTKIIKFDPTVKVMQSIRKPIRITMIGNDAKEYHFLTKFGEDLRQDQRLQQLFTIMNKTLHNDTACRQRQLSIDTYQVIPLSKTVGLIQWIDNTRSLQELINFTLSEQEMKTFNSVREEYKKFIWKAALSKKPYENYKETTQKYSAVKVVAKMNELINETHSDSLRKTLTILCPSVESFITMRRNFITSYATMCIAHWILGIGDRHLQNVLISIDSGRCLGIDFGLAFDAGVDQAIPELMPFRLTPQILGLLKPFTEKDLLGTTMIHVLRALRNEKGPILSCMDVFVHEPLNWTEHINKKLRENDEDITDIKWIPIRKIEAVKKKLNGIKPSLITLDQLREQHNDKYFDRYYVIVTGHDDEIKRPRAKMKNNFLSPEEQVECLLDQATDLNILGRTWVGWTPWL